METFLERYQAGDHVAVWDELVSLGAGVRHELYYADAVAVADETMRRARHNIELLIRRLTDMGYRFIPPADEYMPDPMATMNQVMARASQQTGVALAQLQEAAKRAQDRIAPMMEKLAARRAEQEAKIAKQLRIPPLENPEVFDPPGKHTASQIKKLEKAAGGPLPISLRAWFEQVGGVSLMGSHDVINPKNSRTAADPLVVAPPSQLLQMLDFEEGEGEEGLSLWLAPDDLHKANVSGGDPYQINIPNPAADAPFECERHETTFVNYLRLTFEWGGFPGWDGAADAPLDTIATLREGLLPI